MGTIISNLWKKICYNILCSLLDAGFESIHKLPFSSSKPGPCACMATGREEGVLQEFLSTRGCQYKKPPIAYTVKFLFQVESFYKKGNIRSHNVLTVS